MTGVVVFGVIWFWMQSRTYHSNFMLGFNDFGHFTQRIANTAAGRNFLLETDVLPPFWDHFNPALLLWVPMWRVFPDVNLTFLTQAFCLAGCGHWSIGSLKNWVVPRWLRVVGVWPGCFTRAYRK